jgi:hypothetical protein
MQFCIFTATIIFTGKSEWNKTSVNDAKQGTGLFCENKIAQNVAQLVFLLIFANFNVKKSRKCGEIMTFFKIHPKKHPNGENSPILVPLDAKPCADEGKVLSSQMSKVKSDACG